jgi:hypothetical protein
VKKLTNIKIAVIALSAVALFYFVNTGFGYFGKVKYDRNTADKTAQKKNTEQKNEVAEVKIQTPPAVTYPPLNTELYAQKILALAQGDTKGLWPVKTDYPLPGAILPFKRIVAYYGNFSSTRMGVLGEYPIPEMLSKLNAEIKKWEAADPSTPVIPAIHYIAVTAQGLPGADGKYRLRMPDTEIDKAVNLARQINGIVFLDIQPGLSDVTHEVPALEKYLKMPDVHLGIDPEFYMKTGNKPGTVIGTMNASDINYVSNYLAKLVKDNNLPPKIFIVHRFTQGMVTGTANIIKHPEVQIIMDMDGWGVQTNKLSSYHDYIYEEPVQFTGFKLFYKNDFRQKGSRMLTPSEVLSLTPKPVYIQYQ